MQLCFSKFKMPSCAIYGCSNSTRNAKMLSFFRFPKGKMNCEKWLQLCNGENHINTKNARICEIHFTNDCFKRNLKAELLNLPEKRKLLEEDAVPSLNLRKTLKIDHQRAERCTRQEQKALVNEIIVTSDMENSTEEIVIKEEPIIWDDAAVKQEDDLNANLNDVKSEERFDEKSSSIDPLKQTNDIEQVWIKTESVDNVKDYSFSWCEFKTDHKKARLVRKLKERPMQYPHK